MNKWIQRIATLVVIAFLLSGYGWAVKHAVQGNLGWGDSVKKGLVSFVSFLELFEQSVEEVQKLPETFVKTPENFTPENKLQEDVWALLSYSDPDKKRTLEVRNLRNDSVARQWQVNPSILKPHHRIMHSLLLPDSSIVYSVNGATGLFAIDKEGKQRWKQSTIAHHHGINRGPDGNIWACSYTREQGQFIIYRGLVKLNGRALNYIDNTFSKLDPQTGEILYHKSITEILKENELNHLLLKTPRSTDPFHLNDVEPVQRSSPYWKRGDVFLSMRNISTILHYRPSSGKVIRVLEGPFYAQHDVDVLNDSTLSIFNNNAHINWQSAGSDHAIAENRVDAGDHYSHLTYYHAGQDRYEAGLKEIFAREDIFTFTEGLADWIDARTVFVEEQNSGLLWVLRGDKVLYKNVLPSHHEGHHHLPNWTRILPSP